MRVLITGVHTGLGRELAARYLKEGWEIFAMSRQAPEDISDEGRFRFEAADLSRHEDIGPALRRLLEGVDGLELAILNAGILGDIKDLKDTTLEEARRVMDVNVWANKALLDALFALGIPVRQVVGVSSGAAVNGSGGWGPYNVSKAALNLLLRTYSHEFPNTHFTALAPGVFHTRLIEHILSKPENSRHPGVSRIKEYAKSSKIVTPREAARRLKDALPGLLVRKSGEYVDIRDL